jgi:outer membrane lipoprotein carrier protein
MIMSTRVPVPKGPVLRLVPQRGRGLRRVLIAALAVSASGVLTSAQQATPAQSAETLARALQQHYDQIKDFKASFEQTSRGGVLQLPSGTKATGTVEVKKPGRMRWDYAKPEPQLIVSDGTTINQCYLDTRPPQCEEPQAVPRGDQAPSAMLFLAGRGDILRDFGVSRVDSPVRGTLALRLDPHKSDPNYEYLVVAFDADTYQIRGLMTRDRGASESTIVFSNIKVNTTIPDKDFVFTPPRGAAKPSR